MSHGHITQPGPDVLCYIYPALPLFWATAGLKHSSCAEHMGHGPFFYEDQHWFFFKQAIGAECWPKFLSTLYEAHLSGLGSVW